MAQMSKCCSCIHYNFQNGKCECFIGGIPKDIFVELTQCEHYILQVDDEPDDLPIAIGR